MKVEGTCHCGKIAFTATVDPDTVRVCHCADCQKLSGSAFRAVVPALAGTFVLLRGEPKLYTKTADSGRVRAHAFCSDCGTPIYATEVTNPTNYGLRLGTLNERAALSPKRQIWCRSALPWSMDLRGVRQHERQ